MDEELNFDSLINHDISFDRNFLTKILEPYDYLNHLPSSNNKFRTRIINILNLDFYEIKNDKLVQKIDEIISILHSSSLLIDDIQDYSEFRRGKETSFITYGIPLTINCANMMYFFAFQKCVKEIPIILNDSEPNQCVIEKKIIDMTKFFIEELLNCHYGQGIELYWRDKINCIDFKLPSYNDYFTMVLCKTGGIFRLITKFFNLFSVYEYNLTIIMNLISIIFQIKNDYLDLFDNTNSINKKKIGEDLIEGNLSLPILHCLKTTTNSPVYFFLKKKKLERQATQEDILDCIKYMKDISNTSKFVQDLIIKFYQKTIFLIDNLNDKSNSNSFKDLLKSMCQF